MVMRNPDPEISPDLETLYSVLKTIQQQIEFTRIYEDLGSQQPVWINLDSIIPHSSVPASVTLVSEIADLSVFADPLIDKVFFNLLDNSLRHGQQVTLIRISSRESDGTLTVVWEDNGCGIPDEDKENIFRRGFGKNTGLGMFLAREILSLTDMVIKETGVQGKGARFEITVPKGGWRVKENT
jgi:signal transduction histidine kinase